MPLGKADIHIHTAVSDGMASVERMLEQLESATDLDVAAITDHEDVAGGQRAREIAARRGYRINIVVGAEITTMHGHLLALDIERTPPSFRSVEATLEAIHAQGGVAIAPHPMSWLTRSLSQRTIDRVQARREAGVTFDGLETANPSPAGLATRERARRRNAIWHLPELGGSDAHHLLHAGRGWTNFEGTTADDFMRAIRTGGTMPGMTRYPSTREIGYGQALLGLAWGYTATPRKVAGAVSRKVRRA